MDELERIKKEKVRKMLEKKSYPDRPVKVNDNDFESFVSKYPFVVIDCWANWCGPCKMLGPVIDELSKKYKGRIIFGKLDVTQNKIVPDKYNVRSIPTLLIFKKSELIDKLIGFNSKAELESKLSGYL